VAAAPLAAPNPHPVPPRPAVVAAAPALRAAPAPDAGSSGPWRLQLGAFSVPGNADALWARLKDRPELAGHSRQSTSTGRLSKLYAAGFASQSAAQGACSRLTSAGFACLVTRN
jgi:cell division septation protein DedD